AAITKLFFYPKNTHQKHLDKLYPFKSSTQLIQPASHGKYLPPTPSSSALLTRAIDITPSRTTTPKSTNKRAPGPLLTHPGFHQIIFIMAQRGDKLQQFTNSSWNLPRSTCWLLSWHGRKLIKPASNSRSPGSSLGQSSQQLPKSTQPASVLTMGRLHQHFLTILPQQQVKDHVNISGNCGILHSLVDFGLPLPFSTLLIYAFQLWEALSIMNGDNCAAHTEGESELHDSLAVSIWLWNPSRFKGGHLHPCSLLQRWLLMMMQMTKVTPQPTMGPCPIQQFHSKCGFGPSAIPTQHPVGWSLVGCKYTLSSHGSKKPSFSFSPNGIFGDCSTLWKEKLTQEVTESPSSMCVEYSLVSLQKTSRLVSILL
ncbi:hypothetical protein VP01_2442g1, partial [Puccinia sorghi]